MYIPDTYDGNSDGKVGPQDILERTTQLVCPSPGALVPALALTLVLARALVLMMALELALVQELALTLTLALNATGRLSSPKHRPCLPSPDLESPPCTLPGGIRSRQATGANCKEESSGVRLFRAQLYPQGVGM